jgi:predicted alpha/beta-fold hydrolase
MIECLPFSPALGLHSSHIQTLLGSLGNGGTPPPSRQLLIPLEERDLLSCEESIPPQWTPSKKIIVLVHGLAGSHASGYMVRLGGKFYKKGYRVIRVNLRGCGSGKGLTQRPYYGGVSHDIFKVLELLKQRCPEAPVVIIGFSLGGNIVLKLAGELGEMASKFLYRTIAVCPPVHLGRTVHLLDHPSNRLYKRYYLKHLKRQVHPWTGARKIESGFEYDTHIIAPHWGFRNAEDYYAKCSCQFFIPQIRHSCYVLFTEDDPFIDYRPILNMQIPPSVKISLSPHGGHMGLLSWTGWEHRYFWLDQLLHSWVK